MTSIFADTPKYPGQLGDHARVTVSPLGVVLIRAVDIVAEEAVTIAMGPDQARALAAAILVAANDAEATASETEAPDA